MAVCSLTSRAEACPIPKRPSGTPTRPRLFPRADPSGPCASHQRDLRHEQRHPPGHDGSVHLEQEGQMRAAEHPSQGRTSGQRPGTPAPQRLWTRQERTNYLWPAFSYGRAFGNWLRRGHAIQSRRRRCVQTRGTYQRVPAASNHLTWPFHRAHPNAVRVAGITFVRDTPRLAVSGRDARPA